MQHSFIMWLSVSHLSPFNCLLLFCHVWSTFVVINNDKRICRPCRFCHQPQFKNNIKAKRRQLLEARHIFKIFVEHNGVVIVIVVSSLWTVSKNLEERQAGLETWRSIETMCTTALLSCARILRKVLEVWCDPQSFRLRWKLNSYSWCEEFAKIKISILLLLNRDHLFVRWWVGWLVGFSGT